jgi:PAS domain S-box-containing protein
MPNAQPETDAAALILEGLGQLDQGITIFDRDLRLVAWNDQFLGMLDYPSGLAFVGAEFASFIRFNAVRGEYGPGDADALTAERIDKARRFEKHRFDRERPDGSVIRIIGSPLPQGGFVTTYTDITESLTQNARLQQLIARRTSELEQSEKRLKLIADEVPAGIAHIDADMKVLYANKRFAKAYGKAPEEIIGLNTNQVLLPRTLQDSARFFEQARRGALVDFEMKVELPGNRFKDIRTLLRPESPSSGEVIAFYLVSIDVTRWKATTSALMRSQKMDALGRMASGISHDFNNLLTIVLGNLLPLSEQLSDRDLVEEFLTPAISAARRGSSLTKRLLTLARREQFDPEATDIGVAISEICELLKSSVPSSLRIVHRSRPDLPSAFVDRAQLEMALLNLAMNSRDATEGRGEITVVADSFQLAPEEAELLHLPAGQYVRIRFSDNGCGMSPDQTERIFEPFYTSKASGSGNGLGLSMVYGFVQQSNGAIWVDSDPGAGASFSILLPSADLAPVSAPEPAPEELPPAPAVKPPPDAPIVLLVEDDQDVRRIIRRKIAALGHPLIEAENADEALKLLQRIEGFGTVISDIDMPGTLNGIDLAERIRASYPSLRIVLMSGKARYSSNSVPGAGIVFLRKPFSPADLSEALSKGAPDHRDSTEAPK